jgi:hypothetical protein
MTLIFPVPSFTVKYLKTKIENKLVTSPSIVTVWSTKVLGSLVISLIDTAIAAWANNNQNKTETPAILAANMDLCNMASYLIC